MKPTPQELYAQLYDLYVPDWPGEIDFYRSLLANTGLSVHGILEIACGTGRVALQLAGQGADVVGLDLSPELLDMARRKSAGMSNVHWVQGDMRTFELGKKFGIILIPGHAFQFMNTPGDQVSCLERIKCHLVPDGILVIHLDHQDITWLGDLVKNKPAGYKKRPLLIHPGSGKSYRQSYRWTFEPSTQTATVFVEWEQVNPDGEVVDVWKMDPTPLHCVFRFEMEHLLHRVGFSIEAVYGDFFKGALADESGNMIWVARNKAY